MQRYVQDLLKEDHSTICDLILHSKAHLYVCGSAAMAEDVKKTLQVLVREITVGLWTVIRKKLSNAPPSFTPKLKHV